MDDLASTPFGSQHQDFNATIAGSTGGEQVDLATSGFGSYAGIDAASAGTFNAPNDTTPLVLTSGGAAVGTLTLGGNYSAAVFAVGGCHPPKGAATAGPTANSNAGMPLRPF